MKDRNRKLAVAAIYLGMIPAGILAQQDYKRWSDYGGGADSSKYSALTQIDKTNVGQLEAAWVYPSGDNAAYVFNPVVADNVIYVLARNSSLVALDATTGKEIWVHENLRGITARGVNYWESKDRKDRRLIFSMNSYLQEIDARTGKSILTFGANGVVNLKEGLGRDPKTVARVQSSNPGRIFENLIILGSAPGEGYLSAPGDIRAFDVLTGKQVWSFHTVPHPGEFGYETWPKDAWRYSGGANNWAENSLDEKRGIVYFPTGSATYDYYGADRVGDNLFANSLIALDARTGKRLWHFQTVHHDLWDYDLVSAPQLITVRQNGKTIDAVAQSSKHGFLFAFDRVTGKPLWPIEERPVPKSDVPGEQTSPTQPFPTAPPPFARQKMTPEDVNPYLLTAEERAKWKDRIASALTGLFTPPALGKESIALPGARGGSNWGSTASNPEKGTVYVMTQDWPSFYKLAEQPPGAGRAGRGAGEQSLFTSTCQTCHGAAGAGTAIAPPISGIQARASLEEFRRVLRQGKSEMPAYPNLDEAAVAGLYAFLSAPGGGGRGGRGVAEAPKPLGGPVVASGGAPVPADQAGPGSFGGGMGGPAYPAGITVPPARYYTDYGLGYEYVIKPPWSSLVAYDLNKGTIKWKVPLGEDARAIAEGATDTGTFTAGERHGMIVTASGLIFIAGKDAKLRAYDEETGKVLWTFTLPAGSEGIPAMYEVKGRQYLVVAATSRLLTGGKLGPGPGTPDPTAGSKLAKGYIAFALPEKK
jgi:quinoprotein glucose dehydrogenase